VTPSQLLEPGDSEEATRPPSGMHGLDVAPELQVVALLLPASGFGRLRIDAPKPFALPGSIETRYPRSGLSLDCTESYLAAVSVAASSLPAYSFDAIRNLAPARSASRSSPPILSNEGEIFAEIPLPVH
jgi:hypothetical protein